MAENLAALRLSRDQMAHQLSVTIQERDAERSLSDALAEALRGVLKALVGVEAPIASPWREAQIAPVVKAARAVLPRHDAARGK
jgi:hypothetical protein